MVGTASMPGWGVTRRQLDVRYRLLGLLLDGFLLIWVEFLAARLVDGSLVAGRCVHRRFENVEVFAVMRVDAAHV